MPFMGRDWRSPGEAWVKTESLGWQRMKIIESQLYLTACHPNHPACSWPPRSQFGQHMADNCGKRQRPHQDGNLNCDQMADGNDPTLFRNHSVSPTTSSSSSSSTTPSTTNAPSPSSPSQLSQDNGGQLLSGSNCCGCCCDSSSQPAGSATNASLHHHHHYHHHHHHQHHPCHHHHHLVSDSPQPLHHQPKTAPHCRISVKTREVAMHNTISEAFYRLDFYNAIHDIRRFNYICKLLHLLITQNLTSLSGCATRVLFTMLEQVAWEVSANKRNINVIRNLLAELKQTIQKYYCWGRPIGSSQLWRQHFETIERISQIVDEIELSPPKSDSYKVTFDKLPVEMIREILLRLNDYRDLVNSAQASVVMRTMIDNQCIWKKLCRYHFSDQQLKLAFESNKFNYVKKQQNSCASNKLRGIKYARTTSADRRGSYRSLVTATTADDTTTITTNTTKPTTNKPQADENRLSGQQSERTNNNNHNRHTTDPATAANRVDSSKPNDSNLSSSSYVTNAVRIFDKDCSSSPSGSSSSSSSSGLQSTSSSSNSSSSSSSQRPEERWRRSAPSSNDAANDTSRQALEIDWERVFHQLRKRFDLKEEYADCLLLCRHCRCLFWKSFGHPCIKSEEPIEHGGGIAGGGSCCQGRSSLPAGGNSGRSSSSSGSSTSKNNDYDCDSCNRSNERPTTRSVAAAAPAAVSSSSLSPSSAPLGDGGGQDGNGAGETGDGMVASPRISVALLSRNFDRRALGGAHESIANNENILPSAAGAASGNSDEQRRQPMTRTTTTTDERGSLASGNASSQHLDNGRQPPRRVAAAGCARQPLDNLGAQLREHNVNRQGRQDWQLQGQQQQQPAASDPRRLDAGPDSARLGGGPADQKRNRSGEELVPKHVTISPQAFLKFFSL